MKKTTISKKSWHYRLYLFGYGEGSRTPTNLCPYVWGRLFPILIFGIPALIIALPTIILEMIANRVLSERLQAKLDYPTIKEEGLFSVYLFAAFIMNAVLFFASSIVVFWFLIWTMDWRHPQNFAMIGFLMNFVLICIGLHYLYIHHKKNVGIKVRKLQPNVFWLAVKAWYNRNCPMITWKD